MNGERMGGAPGVDEERMLEDKVREGRLGRGNMIIYSYIITT